MLISTSGKFQFSGMNAGASFRNIIDEQGEKTWKVNEELILMYQSVGKFLSERAKEASYGDGYIDALSEYIQDRFPGIKGFNRRGLYRMKQFMLEIGKDFTFIDEEYGWIDAYD